GACLPRGGCVPASAGACLPRGGCVPAQRRSLSAAWRMRACAAQEAAAPTHRGGLRASIAPDPRRQVIMSSLRNLCYFVLVGAALSVLNVSRAHAESGPELWFVAGAESARPLGLQPGKPVTLSFFWRI